MNIYSSPPELKAALSVFLTFVFFLIYNYLISSQKVTRWITTGSKPERDSLALFLFKRIAGFLILGVIPAFVFYLAFASGPGELGFRVPLPGRMNWWIPLLMALILIIAFSTARNPKNHSRYPQIRIPHWGARPVLSSLMGWMVYLTGYEFLFRGLLLFSTLPVFGTVPAVAVNVSLYSAIHLINGWQETIGAIFFGFVLCMVTLAGGSILPAILLHLTLSFSTDMFSVRSNPDMKFGFMNNTIKSV